MNLADFESNLAKLGLDYALNPGVSDEELAEFELQRALELPFQVKILYKEFNGLSIKSPPLELYSLSQTRQVGEVLVFCRFNNEHDLAFDASRVNEANQWSIINYRSGFVITLTAASFWSNKIWAWVRDEREIWAVEKFT